MRRIEAVDKALLATLVPIWAVCFLLSARSVFQHRAYASVYVSAPENGSAYPTLSAFRAEVDGQASGLRVGDRLLRVGEADLRGVGPLGFFLRLSQQAGSRGRVQVLFERDGELGETSLAAGSLAILWPLLPVSLGFALVGVLGLVRARGALLVRTGFCTLMCTATVFVSVFGGSGLEGIASLGIHVLCTTLGGPLFLRSALLFPQGVPPASRFARVGPWLFAAFGPLEASATYGFPFPPAVGYPASFAVAVASIATGLAVATRNYRRADAIGRRQLKWLVFGLYCAAIPPLAVAGLVVADRRFLPLYLASLTFFLFIPFSLAIAVARYNLFDVDRLLSATASYNVVVLALVGAGLVAVPWFGELSSRLLGIDPRMGQAALSLALAAIVVPMHQRLRPRIDRVFFKERYALDQGIADLLHALSACEDTRALTERVGEELARLLRPEACVVYARTGEAFAPVFAEGRAVPPAFEARSALVATLSERRKPLALGASGRRLGAAEIGPFDRAALETLDAEVVMPVRRGETLLAFLCLGPKRSGDVYTTTDLAHLASVAEAVSGQLRSFDQEQTIRQTQEMQDALRRYVPGVVAEELASGAELSSGEREVSVLFVDIRGYTSFAESRGTAEIFSTVNRYTELVSKIVRKHGGGVVEFNGDGMMAVFGAPRELARKERAAVEAGLEILSAVGDLPVETAGADAGGLSVGIGIATGAAFVGNIHAADRMIWSAIGNTTNLAARLQALTRELDAAMVIDSATWRGSDQAAGNFQHRPAVAIRGRSQVEDVYVVPFGGAGPCAT